MKKYMEKIIGILIVLFVVGTTMQSCSEDSKEEENFLQKIDPVEQLEVLNTNREKELVVNFVRKTYVKDLQINSLSEDRHRKDAGMEHCFIKW